MNSNVAGYIVHASCFLIGFQRIVPAQEAVTSAAFRSHIPEAHHGNHGKLTMQQKRNQQMAGGVRPEMSNIF